jgi:hypothetical protein
MTKRAHHLVQRCALGSADRIVIPAVHPRPPGVRLVDLDVMNWLVWLGLAVIVAGVAAVTGLKPKGTRHVSHTRMMGVGRIALFAIVIIFAYLAYRARSG